LLYFTFAKSIRLTGLPMPTSTAGIGMTANIHSRLICTLVHMHGCHSLIQRHSKFSTIGLKAVLGGLGNTTEIKSTKTLFTEMEQALIASPGGVDSTLVAKIAYDVLGDHVYCNSCFSFGCQKS